MYQSESSGSWSGQSDFQAKMAEEEVSGSIRSLSSLSDLPEPEPWIRKGENLSQLIGIFFMFLYLCVNYILIQGSEETMKEFESCFTNLFDFPGRYPLTSCISLFGVPAKMISIYFQCWMAQLK